MASATAVPPVEAVEAALWVETSTVFVTVGAVTQGSAVATPLIVSDVVETAVGLAVPYQQYPKGLIAATAVPPVVAVIVLPV